MPLQSWISLHATDDVSLSRHQQAGQMWCKGPGADNNWYAIEVDPTTGQIPVTFSGATAPVDFGPTTTAPRQAAVIGNTTGLADFGAGLTTAQTLRVVLPTDQTAIPVNISGGALDFGMSTAAQRVAALLGNPTGLASFGAGVTGAQTLRVVLPTDQTPIPIRSIVSGGVQKQATVTTTAVLANVSGTNLANRTTLTVANMSTDLLYWGYTNAVTAGNGSPITQYQTAVWDIAASQDVWIVSAGSSDIRITEAI